MLFQQLIISKLTVMESGSFYVTLPSNASMDIFPNNALAEYKVKLPSHLSLEGNWEVGLASITFPRTWYTIRVDDCKAYYDDDGTGFLTLVIPEGYYDDIDGIITAINLALSTQGVTGITLKLDKMTQKVTVSLSKGKRFSFENYLGVLLGFGSDIILTKTTTAPYVSDINVGMQSLFIYLNIVEPQIVGDVLAPLLRTVPAQGKMNDVITLNYENPHYVPVTKKDFEIMEVLITSDTGEKIPFERGRVVLTLNFRPRRSPYF